MFLQVPPTSLNKITMKVYQHCSMISVTIFRTTTEYNCPYVINEMCSSYVGN